MAGLAVAIMPASTASAAGPTFALKPVPPTKVGYFVFPGKPGATIRGQVQVVNVGASAGTARLYAVDATTGQTSGAVYRSRQEPRRDVGKWVNLTRAEVSLGPGQERFVPFSVKVPSAASSGQHLGGIVAEPTVLASAHAAAKGKHAFGVKIQALSVVAVQVNLPGPQRVKMTLSGIKAGGVPGHQALLLGIGNVGTILLKGRGSLSVVNHAGRQVQSQRFNLDTFVPDSKVNFPVYVQGKALPPGRYRGTVTIVYRGHRLRRTFPFRITAAQAEQVYGSTAAQGTPSPTGDSSDTALIAILVGVSAVSIGAAGFFFLRTRGAV